MKEDKKELIEHFKQFLKLNIENVKASIKIAEALGCTNEQFFLDYEDELNNLSVCDHNKSRDGRLVISQ